MSTVRDEALQVTAEDYRRADLLIEGMGTASDATRELFAGGIAVARAGGDVKSFLRSQLQRTMPSD